MSKQLDELNKKLEELRDQDISNDQLGPDNGFHDAQQAKNDLIEYFLKSLKEVDTYAAWLNSAVLSESISHIKNALDGLVSYVDEITKTVEQGIHRPDFYGERNNHISKISKLGIDIKKRLHPLEVDLKLECVLHTLDSGGLKTAQDEVKKSVDESRHAAKDIQKILDSVRDNVMQTGVEQSAGTFNSLRTNHADREFWWFCAFLLAAAMTLVAVAYVALNNDKLPTVTSAAISFLLRRLLIISVTIVFLKITLTKYNVERNLHIIYDHRHTVLEQYNIFENAIGDEVSKNAFRLKIAKYIFSDPQTGYLGKDGTPSEINVNPIINMAEKMAKGAT